MKLEHKYTLHLVLKQDEEEIAHRTVEMSPGSFGEFDQLDVPIDIFRLHARAAITYVANKLMERLGMDPVNYWKRLR